MKPIKLKRLNYISPIQKNAVIRLVNSALYLTIGLLIIIVLLITKGV